MTVHGSADFCPGEETKVEGFRALLSLCDCSRAVQAGREDAGWRQCHVCTVTVPIGCLTGTARGTPWPTGDFLGAQQPELAGGFGRS